MDLREGKQIGEVVVELRASYPVEEILPVLVDDVRIGIIDKQDHTIFFGDRTDAQQLVLREYRAGGIRGRDQHDRFRARRDELWQLAHHQAPAALFFESPWNGHAAVEADLLEMRCEAGIGHNNFIAGVDQRAKQRIHALHVARSNEHVALGVDLHAHLLPVMAGDQRAKLRQAVGKRVLPGVRIIRKRVGDGRTNMLRCPKRRQTPRQRNAPLCPRAEHCHLLDRGESDVGDGSGNPVFGRGRHRRSMIAGRPVQRSTEAGLGSGAAQSAQSCRDRAVASA